MSSLLDLTLASVTFIPLMVTTTGEIDGLVDGELPLHQNQTPCTFRSCPVEDSPSLPPGLQPLCPRTSGSALSASPSLTPTTHPAPPASGAASPWTTSTREQHSFGQLDGTPAGEEERGPTQQVESKFSDLKLKPTSWLSSDSPHPKIVFNRLNGKRYHGAAEQKTGGPADGFTPAHEENVRFVYEAWQEVEQKLADGDDGESTSSQGPIQYSEKTPSAAMKNFVPIDLEEWWAQRFLANIANLS